MTLFIHKKQFHLENGKIGIIIHRQIREVAHF